MKKTVRINGNKPKALTNANLFEAEEVIFDLCELVPSEEKDIARILLKEAFSSMDYTKIHTIVKINPGDSVDGKKDLISVMEIQPDSIIVPICCREMFFDMSEQMKELNASRHINIICAVETAASVEVIKDLMRRGEKIFGVYLDVKKILEDMCSDEEEKKEIYLFLKVSMKVLCRAYGTLLIDSEEVGIY